MKKNFISRYMLLPVIAGSCLMTACHSTLYQAAQNGDISTVKKEIQYAKTLSAAEKQEYLEGSPPASNLFWIIPYGAITVPIDMTIFIASFGTYAMLENTLTDVAWANFWSGRYTSAVSESFAKGHTDITYELMEAGAITPKHIRDWMYTYYYPKLVQTVHTPTLPKPPKPPTPPKPNPDSTAPADSTNLPGQTVRPGE